MPEFGQRMREIIPRKTKWLRDFLGSPHLLALILQEYRCAGENQARASSVMRLAAFAIESSCLQDGYVATHTQL